MVPFKIVSSCSLETGKIMCGCPEGIDVGASIYCSNKFAAISPSFSFGWLILGTRVESYNLVTLELSKLITVKSSGTEMFFEAR